MNSFFIGNNKIRSQKQNYDANYKTHVIVCWSYKFNINMADQPANLDLGNITERIKLVYNEDTWA